MRRTNRVTSISTAVVLATCLAAAMTEWRLFAQAPAPDKNVKYSMIDQAGMKEWLTYLSSDELLGRQIFTEGYGLAAGYVSDHLRQWGLKPLGDHGTYLQTVRLKGYNVKRNSTVTVDVNGQSRTFKQGEHVTFTANSGGKQTLTFDGVQFAGSAAANVTADAKGKLVVWMNSVAPAAAGAAAGGGGRGGRGGGGNPGTAAITQGAGAVISFAPTPAPPSDAQVALTKAQDALTQASAAVTTAEQSVAGRGAGGRGFGAAGGAGGRGAGGRGALPTADITTVQKVDGPVTPNFSGDETFFEFLLSGAPTKFADLKAKADKGEPLSAFAVPNVKVTINVDNIFEVVSEQISHNVVAMLEGSDPKLKDTYVMIGAHLDHIGYSQTGGGNPPSPTGCRRRSPVAVDALEKAGKKPQNPQSLDSAAAAAAAAGRAGAGGRGGAGGGGRGAAAAPPLPFDQRDFISNGADDDGSGSTSELAVAKAFAMGPRPKRSIVFVWHTGEEAGLYGSRYNADFPVVPLDKVQAQLNMDMVGRDDCDDLEGDYSNTLFLVGADRISTDLHNIIVEQNTTLAKPLTLDYELNDVNDPESVYTRSDHYSYAAKGIPIAFFTTGLHPDYHRVSDTVDKILFPKMARIAQLVYETGFSIANTDKVLERDNKGPRTGFGSKPEVIKK
jgi:Zn-dependent M28 family amino/carboxypeptidase